MRLKWYAEMNKPFAIFDMDGTLIDSMKLWRNLGREYLETKGIIEDLNDILEKIRSMTVSEAAELFVRKKKTTTGNRFVVLRMRP